MAQFPILITGALVQHPLGSFLGTGTEVIRFLDGLDQRCPTTSTPLRAWTVKLDQLTEQETASLEQFFADVQGSFGTFAFTDPESGVVFPNCRLQATNLETAYQDLGNGATDLVVVEVRG